MLEYLRNKCNDEDVNKDYVKKPTQKYRGPPPPPNRYKIMPGARWDGVDRSNGIKLYIVISNLFLIFKRIFILKVLKRNILKVLMRKKLETKKLTNGVLKTCEDETISF